MIKEKKKITLDKRVVRLIKEMDIENAINFLPSLPDKDKTPFINRELVKEVVKRFCLQMSVGKNMDMKDVKKLHLKKFGKHSAKGFENGWRYARNNLQEQKIKLLDN